MSFSSLIKAALLTAVLAHCQRPPANYDEAKVPKYTLPDPLVLLNGSPVKDAKTWTERRRPEILELFRNHVYGRSPARPKAMTFELLSLDPQALGGTAVRKQVEINFTGAKDGPRMTLLVYLPAAAKDRRSPVFLGLSFSPNHAVSADPGILLGDVWVKGQKQPAAERSRGSGAAHWPIQTILARGYGVALAYYFTIEPDFDGGEKYGVRPSFPGFDWGAIGAWAWGLSRAMDYLETDPGVDPHRVIVHGHSRLGKTALWAGAQDTRFAMVISNDSGEGGAALSRRRFGETVADLNQRFPHWFSHNYRKYNGREDDLPVDQHMLLALIAPRPLYVASATEDLWADPRGEFLSLVAAGPVYRLLGKRDLETDRMPAPDHPIQTDVAYHLRTGPHDINAWDWDQYLDFAVKHLPPAR
ncbi:MAG: acetylxylan esterase [Bryobacterales bacterium]|nr:acetylxylan esterase [Bryobacterales bacterium]